MTFTNDEKQKLKDNCIAIKNWCIDLVKDYYTDITLSVDFFRNRDHHKLGISVSKRNDKIEVYGYIGGLGIKFEGECSDCYTSLAWTYVDYAIELLTQWQSIKSQLLLKLKQELATKNQINNFVI